MPGHDRHRSLVPVAGHQVRQAPHQLNWTISGKKSGIGLLNGNIADDDDADWLHLPESCSEPWTFVNRPRAAQYAEPSSRPKHPVLRPQTASSKTTTGDDETFEEDEQDKDRDILADFVHPLGESTFPDNSTEIHSVGLGRLRRSASAVEADLRGMGEKFQHIDDHVECRLYRMFRNYCKYDGMQHSEPNPRHIFRDDAQGYARRVFAVGLDIIKRSNSY